MIAMGFLVLIVGFAAGWLVGVADFAGSARKAIKVLPIIERRRYSRP